MGNLNYKVQIVDGQLPQRSRLSDACLDVIASNDPVFYGILGLSNSDSPEEVPYEDLRRVEANRLFNKLLYIEYDTGIKLQPLTESDKDVYVTFCFPRSSISKYNLMLANSVGVIDQGYTGNLLLRFKYIWQPCDFFRPSDGPLMGKVDLGSIYKKGDKIGQIYFDQVKDVNLIEVASLSATERGSGGFGSTGK